jgi:tRNA (cytidine/uridine-2'-O-)-methyltransferase
MTEATLHAPLGATLHLALYQPEIPPNTGNVIRLCANIGACLHLIHPLGFALEDKQLRRAGLDYHEWASVKQYPDFATWYQVFQQHRIFACTTKGSQRYDRVSYQPNDVFLFGPETRGLPADVLALIPESERIRIPMQAHSRSLNLSNSVAVIAYEALRQGHFEGLG